MTGIIIASLFISCFYTFLIVSFIRGWYSISEYFPATEVPKVKVSLIIPFRNEKQILRKSIVSVLELEYPSSLLEVVYVNDHSDDGSVELIMPFIESRKNFRLINCGNSSYGKKAALTMGAEIAQGDLLLFTDADCFPETDWVKTMALFFQEKKPVMISGPVLIKNRTGFFNQFQSLEFLSLIGSGAGSIGAGYPVLCNGANLGFDKKVYLNSVENINHEVASGDDIFMMLFLKKVYPGGVLFIKSGKALVFTEPVSDIISFVKQRIRWVSKTRYYRDFGILFTAFIVLIINMLLLTLLFFGLFDRWFLAVYGLIFLVKSINDIFLLGGVCAFFRQKKLLGLFIPVQLAYPFYTVFSGFAGLLIKTDWKGRRISDGKAVEMQ